MKLTDRLRSITRASVYDLETISEAAQILENIEEYLSKAPDALPEEIASGLAGEE